MTRRLADDEVMQRGDYLMVNGTLYEVVKGFDGYLAAYWVLTALRQCGIDGKYWVETDRPLPLDVLCDRLIIGLEKIRSEL